MRYMVIVHPGGRQEYEAGKMPDKESLLTMTKFNEELVDAGVMLAGEGLLPTKEGARLHFSGKGAPTVTQGPWPESEELVGGFWLWKVKSKEEALQWAKRAPMEDGATLELRKLAEPEDFDIEIEEREHALQDKIKKQQSR